ncbi:50S ribosomal protein L11 methyltransferase, partial [Halomonas sp. BM-2019]|uniref:50S ribosomal protein L11 methyltransferase n=1 Tax=Halomonas sp. BM-2019 TaxID=2811227 RepID=UPI001B3C46EE
STPLWDETVLTGLYDDLEGIDAMLERVRQAWATVVPEEPCPEIETELLADRDWEREWMEDFKPMQMGQRLWIVPSWHEPPEPGAVNLHLDPGLAFGTGTHPTTALCLAWLDGTDIDPQALTASRDNAARNAIAEARLRLCYPEQLDDAETFPIVVANILAGPLVELAPMIAGHVAPGGRLALSGILAAQAEEVIDAYHDQGLHMDEPVV